MKTKLETKFQKQSKQFIKELNKAELKYELFLKNFIKNEIIGRKDFNESLNNEIKELKYGYFDWKPHELLPLYLKNKDFLETIIELQILSLEDRNQFPRGENGTYELALAKEGK